MTNGQLKNQKPVAVNNPQPQKSVLILKLLILSVILFIPLTFMIVDVAKTLLILKVSVMQSVKKDSLQKSNAANEFNFVAPLPANQIGDISSVPKEKVDSLFNNLKK
jgi:hypothetical protein